MEGRNTRWNILNAAASAVAINMTTPYVGIWAVKLGADNQQLGYLSSWPNLLSVVAVLGLAAAVAQSRHKQRLIAAIFLAGRAAALGAAAVPWLPEPWRVWALVLFWTLSVFPTSAAGTALQSFVADVFPGRERGVAFAARNSWATGVGMVVVFTTGLMLDYLFPEPLGYQVMFAGSFLFAVAEVFCFLQLREPAQQAAAPQPAAVTGSSVLRSFWKAIQHKPFARFLLASIPFHFTWQMAWPLFTRYQVTDLGLSNTWMSLIGVSNSLAMVIWFPIWARLAQRYGNARLLVFAALNLATAPAAHAALSTGPMLVLLNQWTGIGVGGVQLLVLNCQLDVSPPEERPVYLAVHSALVAVSAAIAPVVGAYVMDAMPTRKGLLFATLLRTVSAVLLYLWAFRSVRGKGITPATAKPS